jgi:hypothetical protein
MRLKPILSIAVIVVCASIAFPLPGMAESPQFRNFVINTATGETLAEHSGWIYLKNKTTAKWKKLIPGSCPQWHPDGKTFFYYLDVGYDGARKELWRANVEGEDRIRLTRSDYFVVESPVVSQDGQKLAFHYHTCIASGDFHEIVVIEPSQFGLDQRSEAKVVLRTKNGLDSGSLRWTGQHELEVHMNGKKTKIDTAGKGKEQLP